MQERDKQESTNPIKEIVPLSEKEKKEFELKFSTLTPYNHLGGWVQLIWRPKI